MWVGHTLVEAVWGPSVDQALIIIRLEVEVGPTAITTRSLTIKWEDLPCIRGLTGAAEVVGAVMDLPTQVTYRRTLEDPHPTTMDRRLTIPTEEAVAVEATGTPCQWDRPITVVEGGTWADQAHTGVEEAAVLQAITTDPRQVDPWGVGGWEALVGRLQP